MLRHHVAPALAFPARPGALAFRPPRVPPPPGSSSRSSGRVVYAERPHDFHSLLEFTYNVHLLLCYKNCIYCPANRFVQFRLLVIIRRIFTSRRTANRTSSLWDPSSVRPHRSHLLSARSNCPSCTSEGAETPLLFCHCVLSKHLLWPCSPAVYFLWLSDETSILRNRD